uniref:BAG domain-containing protein n=1 Tax=Glossina brevipalpis TaxID=37001 RepID=A0A1A9W2K3_9MUSC
MEINSTPVPPLQNSSSTSCHSESSTNSDCLPDLHANTLAMGTTIATCSSRPEEVGSPCHCNAVNTSLTNCQVNDSNMADEPFNLNERFVSVLDQLDARVGKFRKDALNLQERRDFLLMSIDLIKNNDSVENLTESEREDINCYLQQINARLSTVELNVRTIRDHSQEDYLSQINCLIDSMLSMGDAVLSKQRCQMYLNACSGADKDVTDSGFIEENGLEVDAGAGPVDKKFESVLLGCTLDDQKNIKKRLLALMGYLNQQIVNQ